MTVDADSIRRHAFIQAMMARGCLSEEDAKAIFKDLGSGHSGSVEEEPPLHCPFARLRERTLLTFPSLRILIDAPPCHVPPQTRTSTASWRRSTISSSLCTWRSGQ